MTLNKIYTITGKLIVIGLAIGILVIISLLISDALNIMQTIQDMSTYLED